MSLCPRCRGLPDENTGRCPECEPLLAPLEPRAAAVRLRAWLSRHRLSQFIAFGPSAPDLDAVLGDYERVNGELVDAGIEYPKGSRGVRDLAAMAAGRLEDLEAAQAENARLRDLAAEMMRDLNALGAGTDHYRARLAGGGELLPHLAIDERRTVTDAPVLRHRDGDQPLPTVNQHPVIQDLVVQDINTHRELGIQRYGTALQPFNGRDSLRDAYEEILDLAMYLRQVMYERDTQRGMGAVLAALVDDRDCAYGPDRMCSVHGREPMPPFDVCPNQAGREVLGLLHLPF